MVPNATEEKLLFEQYHKTHSTDDRNAIVEMFLPIVKRQAFRVSQKLPDSVDLDDLISTGVFGLMEVIETFDPSRGVRFTTYCVPRIRGAILDALREKDWLSRLSRIRCKKYTDAVDHLMQELGRNPDDSELADYLGIDFGELAQLVAVSQSAQNVSFDHPITEDDNGRTIYRHMLDDGIDRRTPSPAASVIDKDRWRLMLRGCSKIERMILIGYYREGWTMKKIGDEVGLSESRVSQMMSRLLRHLRNRLEGRRNEFF